eukprot:TRINITY_DN2521_c0_g1_i2.p1 TRINITY_DN2521_c0_g1~~TRINITY_DN2521_c0_g1_i2.p1  ORF type:complete len:663 (-),score=106.86 TRINITY_DN2521_c0_g1_i2:85-2037(-)
MEIMVPTKSVSSLMTCNRASTSIDPRKLGWSFFVLDDILIRVQCSASETVSSLKDRLVRDYAFPPTLDALWFSGKRLHDEAGVMDAHPLLYNGARLLCTHGSVLRGGSQRGLNDMEEDRALHCTDEQAKAELSLAEEQQDARTDMVQDPPSESECHNRDNDFVRAPSDAEDGSVSGSAPPKRVSLEDTAWILPDDVSELVFGLLPLSAVDSVSRVCTALNKIINTSNNLWCALVERDFGPVDYDDISWQSTYRMMKACVGSSSVVQILAQAVQAARKQDAKMRLRLLIVAAERGSAKAALDCAVFFEADEGTTNPHAQTLAIKYATIAAEGNFKRGFGVRGLAYLNGWGVAKDVERGLKDLELAAMAGDGDSAWHLAWAFKKGEYKTLTNSRYIELLKMGVMQKLPHARALLAWEYLQGKHVGPDEARAHMLAKELKPQGASIYVTIGRKIEQLGLSDEEIFNIYARGVKTCTRCMFKVACRLSDGIGCEKDLQRSARLFANAADRGSILAKANLAEMYECGLGVPQDYAKAVRLYLKAVKEGVVIPYASLRLGWLHERGIGGLPQDQAAAQYYQNAASQNSKEEALIAKYLLRSDREDSIAEEILRKMADGGLDTAVEYLRRHCESKSIVLYPLTFRCAVAAAAAAHLL